MCLNTDQSECNGTPTTTPPPLTLHRGGCHMLRSGHSEAHMPPQETSKNSPRAPQSWARLTYSLPSPPHTYLNSGAELWFHHAGLKKKSAGAWWLSFLRCSGIESISAISPRYVLATSTKQTLKEWRAVRPPVCTQSITPPSGHRQETGCSWATHTIHNAEPLRETPTQTPFPTVWWREAWACKEGHKCRSPQCHTARQI